MRTYVAVCLMALWLAGCGGDVPTAPPYVYDLLESTEVEWDIDGEKIGGHYTIKHPGEAGHGYVVILSLVSDNDKYVVMNNTSPKPLQDVSRAYFSEFNPAFGKTHGWATAHIWCEVRVYDASGRVVFHGIKRSALFPGKQIEEEAVSAPLEERILLGLDKRKTWSIHKVKLAMNKPGVSVSLAKSETGEVLVHAWSGNEKRLQHRDDAAR